MKFVSSPILLNEDDCFLMAAGGKLEPETNSLVVVSGFALGLMEHCDPYVHTILGNKINRGSHHLADDIRLYNVCVERIGGYLVGAFQMFYDPKRNLIDHLAWQSCKVLSHKMAKSDNKDEMKIHLEYPFSEPDEKLDKMFREHLPDNVVVHTRF